MLKVVHDLALCQHRFRCDVSQRTATSQTLRERVYSYQMEDYDRTIRFAVRSLWVSQRPGESFDLSQNVPAQRGTKLDDVYERLSSHLEPLQQLT